MFRAAFYKGTRPGLAGLYNRLGRWLDHGPYSHCEMQFSDGLSGSSSFMDGGVRFKQIGYSSVDNWDFVDLPPHLENMAYCWFLKHNGQGYDVMGNINALLGFVPHTSSKWFCSEAMAAALDFADPWRLKPNGLYARLTERR
jgi:hypothetical protein